MINDVCVRLLTLLHYAQASMSILKSCNFMVKFINRNMQVMVAHFSILCQLKDHIHANWNETSDDTRIVIQRKVFQTVL